MALPYFQGCCDGSGTPTQPTNLFRQARFRDTGLLANVWLPANAVQCSAADPDLEFYNPEDGMCYFVDCDDPPSTTPGHVIAGWQVLTPELTALVCTAQANCTRRLINNTIQATITISGMPPANTVFDWDDTHTVQYTENLNGDYIFSGAEMQGDVFRLLPARAVFKRRSDGVITENYNCELTLTGGTTGGPYLLSIVGPTGGTSAEFFRTPTINIKYACVQCRNLAKMGFLFEQQPSPYNKIGMTGIAVLHQGLSNTKPPHTLTDPIDPSMTLALWFQSMPPVGTRRTVVYEDNTEIWEIAHAMNGPLKGIDVPGGSPGSTHDYGWDGNFLEHGIIRRVNNLTDEPLGQMELRHYITFTAAGQWRYRIQTPGAELVVFDTGLVTFMENLGDVLTNTAPLFPGVGTMDVYRNDEVPV